MLEDLEAFAAGASALGKRGSPACRTAYWPRPPQGKVSPGQASVCRSVSQVLFLRRVAYGTLLLPHHLKPGASRLLDPEEITAL